MNMTREQMNAAVQYAEQNGVDFTTARLRVMASVAGVPQHATAGYAAAVGQYEDRQARQQLAAPSAAPQQPEAMTKYQYDAAIAYQAQHGVTWELARQWALCHVTG